MLDAFRLGALVSLGYAGVFLVAGLLVAAGLRPLLRLAPWAAVALGAGFVALGIALALGRRINLRLPTIGVGPRGRTPVQAMVFGAAYGIASLSCTLAVFLAVIGRALATDGVRSMVTVLVAYAAGSSTLLVGLALSAALARAAWSDSCGGSSPSPTASAASSWSPPGFRSWPTGCPSSPGPPGRGPAPPGPPAPPPPDFSRLAAACWSRWQRCFSSPRPARAGSPAVGAGARPPRTKWTSSPRS